MADDLIIEGLRLSSPSSPRDTLPGGQVIVDAVVETSFDEQEGAELSIPVICREIERLCAQNGSEPLETVIGIAIDGLMAGFPAIEGIELTMRVIDLQPPNIPVSAIGVRRRRHRPQAGQRLPRRTIKPLPSPR